LPGKSKAPESESDYFVAEGGMGGKLKLWMLSVLVGILVLESWLFHRFAVY
jgi:hypothetical protein